MSSVSGGGLRGRGRGNGQTAPRGPSASRAAHGGRGGRNSINNTRRGNHVVRGTQGAVGRGGAARGGARAPDQTSRANGFIAANTQAVGGSKTHGDWQHRHQTLKQLREKERTDAIRRGLMADPDKPRALADAITPVGTCQDMCPEYERVLRVVQKDVWNEETDPNHWAYARGEPEPDEARMVKKFRRSAAGNDEQLPSDLRPPPVLKRTCDYLFNEVIGQAPSLAKVHHFVWDRTRAVRNDFSIQQLTKPEDLRIAIECYERIARFHIVSLHLLALPQRPYAKYDAQQEREQLDRTLVSLMQYYDDCRGRLQMSNEAEFRAYTIIFQLRDPNPDLEHRVQSWPPAITQNPRVRKALDLYVAACNTYDTQGPLKPGASHVIARQNWEGFWQIVSSKGVSYLMGCVAEIYFGLIRRMALRSLFRASSKKPPSSDKSTVGMEWSIDDLWELFNFDDESELIKFCDGFGFSFRERAEDGQRFLDLGSVPGRTFPATTAGALVQSKSSLIESKRYKRSIPAIIDGLSVQQAGIAGLLLENEIENEDSGMSDNASTPEHNLNLAHEPQDDEDSLFVPEVRSLAVELKEPLTTDTSASASGSSLFNSPSTPAFGKPSSFGQPTQSTGFQFVQRQTAAPSQVQGVPGKSPSFVFPSGPKKGDDTDQKDTTTPLFAFKSDASAKPSQPTVDTAPLFSLKPPASSSLFTFSGTPANSDAKEKPDTFLSPPTGPEISSSNGDVTSMNAGSNASMPSIAQSIPSNTPQPTMSIFAQPSTLQEKPTVSPAQTGNDQSSAAFTFPQSNPPTFASPQEASAKPVQPSAPAQFTVPSAQTTNSSPATSSPSPSNNANPQNMRRQSVNDWKPKTPSKLSNSITVTDDGSVPNPNHANELFPVNKLSAPPFTVKPNEVTTTSPAPVRQPLPPTPVQPAPTLDTVLTRLAHELTFDSIAGFMKQYVDFFVGQVVTEVQEKIYFERVNKEADDFRHFSLAVKFGKKWRSLCRHHRLIKQGRERRQRAQRRLQRATQSGHPDDLSLADDASMREYSKTPSVTARSEEVDALFQSTLGPSQTVRTMQANMGIKRPATSNTRDAHGHKRLKSGNVGDDDQSVIPTHSSLPNPSDPLSRSSFLGFSLASNAPDRTSTTKSPYFRMKAIGIKIGLDAGAAQGSKRPRSESLNVSTSKYTKLDAPSVRSSPERTNISDARPFTSSSVAAGTITHAADEALFARMRAARESLQSSVNFMKSEVEKDDKLRNSIGSKAASESPSMALARVEARRRAARASKLPANGDAVPAYRLRESLFVPRDSFVQAIERSKEIRASRSRENSRPNSGEGHRSKKTDAISSTKTSRPSVSALTRSGEPSDSHNVGSHKPVNETVAPSQVPSVLRNSFGRHPSASHGHFTSVSQGHALSHSQANPGSHSQTPSHTTSALSNGHVNTSPDSLYCEEQVQPGHHALHSSRHHGSPQSRGLLNNRHSINPSTNLSASFSSVNRFAALNDDDDGDEAIDFEAEDVGGYGWHDKTAMGNGSEEYDLEDDEVHSHAYDGTEFASGSDVEDDILHNMDGDIEDYDDDDEEDEEEDGDEPESDLDDDHDEGQAPAMGRYFIPNPPKLPALANNGPGQNADEPIELSD